jgi:putative two-component system response regulator
VSLSREHRSQFLGHGLRELGEVYLALGDVERGEAFLEEALEATLTDDPAAASTAEVRCGVLRARAAFNAGRGRHEEAVRDLQAALDIAVSARLRAEELEVHTSLAVSYKALGRFDVALEHQERRFELNQAMFNEGADLRFRTLQVDREASEAKLQSQLMSERASTVEGILEAGEPASRHVEAFVLDRLAALGEHEGSALHGRAVGTLAAAIAEEMGQAQEDVERLRVAARLHDLGRIGVPDGVLGKPGPLTPDEVRQVRTHTTIGAAVLGSGDSPLMQLAASVALTHHEHWDGSGYPAGLAADEIPLEGRIVAVADAYATLVTPQTYRPAETTEVAIARIREAAGSHFDPAVVAAFVRVMSASARPGAVDGEQPVPTDRALR